MTRRIEFLRPTGYLTGLLQRRLLEVLFDGKPEAAEQARFAKTQRIAAITKQRERLIIPADATEVGKTRAPLRKPGPGGTGRSRAGRRDNF